jgi:hypothetical protein
MWSTKDFIIFFAGAQAFHTFGHIMISIFCTLPMQCFITMTSQLNMWLMIINALVTLILLWWASQLKCCSQS